MTEPGAVHRPRKRFGQHFLHDPGIVERIIAAIDPKPGEHLVEIGPGLGALTRSMLPLTGHLDVIELDRDVIPELRRRCAGAGDLRVHAADALRFDFAGLARNGRPLRLFGNLPYNISTPLLFHLLDQSAVVGDAHFMLQKEVVQRLAAAPGSSAYGRLGVMVQYACRVERLFDVAPGAFTPPPRVMSSVVCLSPHRRPPVAVRDRDHLALVVSRAFGQRRKTLRNALKGLVPAGTLERLGIDPALRAERLTLEEFARISNTLVQKDNPERD